MTTNDHDASVKKPQGRRFSDPEIARQAASALIRNNMDATAAALELRPHRAARAKKVGAAFINMETGAIRRILKRARRWHLFAGEVRPLKESSQVGRALSHEEKVRLLRTAATRPKWQVARLAMTLRSTPRCGAVN